MHTNKAMEIATHGPRTESQRRQAITALRAFAKSNHVRLNYPDLAARARSAARDLEKLGDVNKRNTVHSK